MPQPWDQVVKNHVYHMDDDGHKMPLTGSSNYFRTQDRWITPNYMYSYFEISGTERKQIVQIGRNYPFSVVTREITEYKPLGSGYSSEGKYFADGDDLVLVELIRDPSSPEVPFRIRVVRVNSSGSLNTIFYSIDDKIIPSWQISFKIENDSDGSVILIVHHAGSSEKTGNYSNEYKWNKTHYKLSKTNSNYTKNVVSIDNVVSYPHEIPGNPQLDLGIETMTRLGRYHRENVTLDVGWEGLGAYGWPDKPTQIIVTDIMTGVEGVIATLPRGTGILNFADPQKKNPTGLINRPISITNQARYGKKTFIIGLVNSDYTAIMYSEDVNGTRTVVKWVCPQGNLGIYDILGSYAGDSHGNFYVRVQRNSGGVSLYKIGPTGETIWRRLVGVNGMGIFHFFDDDTRIFYSEENKLCYIEAETGFDIWTYTANLRLPNPGVTGTVNYGTYGAMIYPDGDGYSLYIPIRRILSNNANVTPDQRLAPVMCKLHMTRYKADYELINSDGGRFENYMPILVKNKEEEISFPIYFDDPIEITAHPELFGYRIDNPDQLLTDDSTVEIIVAEIKEIDLTEYEISTPEQFRTIGHDQLGIYKIMNDIDMVGKPYETRCLDMEKPFQGKIDGQGFTVNNLVVTEAAGAENAGLFGACFGAAFINLDFNNCRIENSSTAGSAGFLAGKIENTLHGRPVIEEHTQVKNCKFVACAVSSNDTTGGLFGVVEILSPPHNFIDSVVADKFEVSTGGGYAGGLVGRLQLHSLWGSTGLEPTACKVNNVRADGNLKATGGYIHRAGSLIADVYMSGGTRLDVSAVSCSTVVDSDMLGSVGLVAGLSDYGDGYSFVDVGSDLTVNSGASSIGGLIGELNK